MAYKSVNPFNGETLRSFEFMTDRQLEEAIARAESAYEQEWSRKGISYRGSVLKRAATILRERLDDFARPITLEMGKLWAESQAEVKLSADILEYYANFGKKFLAPKKRDVLEGEAVVESEPLGIIFGVEPWNFPYYQLARVVGPNFILGNVMMVKHASNVPQCAEAFEKLFRDAGAPAGVYTNLFVTKDQIAQIISDPRIKAVALTGSEAAGAIVASQAGKNLKKSTLELGGSDPFMVLEDADLDRAVAWAVWGRMNNTGQCCVASKRFIVVDKIADRFLDRFKASLQQLNPGDPMDPSTTLGPLSSEGELKELLKQVEVAVERGATLTDEAQAIVLANDSPFGLGGSVFSSDIERGKGVARNINTGMVFINQATWTAPELPFGGINNSGYGRELSELGIQEFVNKKLIQVSDALPEPEFQVA